MIKSPKKFNFVCVAGVKNRKCADEIILNFNNQKTVQSLIFVNRKGVLFFFNCN